jgi:hypothetical protein
MKYITSDSTSRTVYRFDDCGLTKRIWVHEQTSENIKNEPETIVATFTDKRSETFSPQERKELGASGRDIEIELYINNSAGGKAIFKVSPNEKYDKVDFFGRGRSAPREVFISCGKAFPLLEDRLSEEHRSYLAHAIKSTEKVGGKI